LFHLQAHQNGRLLEGLGLGKLLLAQHHRQFIFGRVLQFFDLILPGMTARFRVLAECRGGGHWWLQTGKIRQLAGGERGQFPAAIHGFQPILPLMALQPPHEQCQQANS